MLAPRRALSFLTPVGGAAAPTPGALAWFPAVGAGIGAVLGVLWWGMAHAWPASVGAAVVVAADLAVTGMLHLDGLVDAADGLLPHLPRQRRLAVMREPGAGAFGLAAGGAALLLRFAALATIAPSILLLVGVWAASRALMAVIATTVPYARAGSGGLATAFLRGHHRLHCPCCPGGRCDRRGRGYRDRPCLRDRLAPLAGSVALVAGALAAAGVVWLSVRRVGGFTGDVLGAAGIVLETVALVVAAARW